MSLVNRTITVSSFEQGGFYVNNGSEYSSSTEIRSSKLTIPGFLETGVIQTITVISENNQWSFVCYTSTDTFVNTYDQSLGYKESGTIINISSYTTVRKIRIELHNANGISPPQDALLNIVYEDNVTWEMRDGVLTPIYAPDLPDPPFIDPIPESVWRIENGELTTGLMIPVSTPVMIKPYPLSMWYVDTDLGYPLLGAFPDMPMLGAFANAVEMNRVEISDNLTAIGEVSFRGTQLTEVEIPTGCTYKSTSFPQGCEIKYKEQT